MKRLIPVLFLLIFFLACSDSTPKGVLARENMVNLLTDMHVVDGYANTLPTDSLTRKTYPLYRSVFKKYNTDSINFRRSIDFYTRRPEELKQIYVSVTTKLENMQKAEQKRLDDIRKREEKARQDSIKKIEKVRQDSIKKVNDKKKKDELQKKFNAKKIMKNDSVKKQELKKKNDLSGERKR